MPRAPRVPCRSHLQGCAALVDPAFKAKHKGFCPNCKAKYESNYDKHQRQHQGLYNSTRWRKARASFLVRYPICVECDKPSTTVDHKIPHQGNIVLFWDVSNWQAMCGSCHSAKTAREGGFGNK